MSLFRVACVKQVEEILLLRSNSLRSYSIFDLVSLSIMVLHFEECRRILIGLGCDKEENDR